METGAYYQEYLVHPTSIHWESKEVHHQWPLSGEFRAIHSGPHADFLLAHPEFGGYEVGLMSHPMEAKMRLEIKARHKRERRT